MKVLFSTLCWLMVAGAGFSNSFEQNPDPAPAHHIAKQLQKQQLVTPFQTAFKFTLLNNIPLTRLVAWRDLYVRSVVTKKFTGIGSCYSVDTFQLDANGEPTIKTTDTWDGSEWTRVDYELRSCRISPLPPFDWQVDCLALFNTTVGPSIVSVEYAVADYLLHMPLTHHKQDGDMHELFYRTGDLSTATLVFQVDSQVRLLSAQSSIYDAENPDEPMLRVKYHVQEWMNYNNYLIPKLAYRDAYLYPSSVTRTRPIEATLSRSVFEREEIAYGNHWKLQPRSENIDTACEQVIDERLHLRYSSGDQDVDVDGIIYPTNRPMSYVHTNALPELIAEVEPMALVSDKGETGDTTRSGKAWGMLRSSAIAIGCFFAVIIIVSFVRKRFAT